MASLIFQHLHQTPPKVGLNHKLRADVTEEFAIAYDYNKKWVPSNSRICRKDHASPIQTKYG